MTEDRNVFESLDSIIAMVTDSGEDLTADRIKYLYNAFLSAIDEAKKEDEFYRDKFINEWNIQYRKSPARYRANQDIMFDLAGLWLRSNNAIRDEICKMAIGVSDDNKDFYRIMDSYHFEMYRAVISDEEKDSIFSSVDALNNALDNAIEKDCQRPSHDTLAVVYKYIAFGYNRALADTELKKRLSDIGIETADGFCRMSHDLVICYGNGSTDIQLELQRIFYQGIPWDALMFVNVMDRLWKYIFKENNAYE